MNAVSSASAHRRPGRRQAVAPRQDGMLGVTRRCIGRCRDDVAKTARPTQFSRGRCDQLRGTATSWRRRTARCPSTRWDRAEPASQPANGARRRPGTTNSGSIGLSIVPAARSFRAGTDEQGLPCGIQLTAARATSFPRSGSPRCLAGNGGRSSTCLGRLARPTLRSVPGRRSRSRLRFRCVQRCGGRSQ